MICQSTAYKVTLKTCITSIVLKAGLPPNQELFWTITNKFGTQRMKVETSDSIGTLTIDLTSFPPVTFNEYAGSFILDIRDLNAKVLDLTFADNIFQAVEIDFAIMKDASGNPHNIIE